MNVELRSYIKNHILPRYAEADGGHGITHIDYVIGRSMRFAKEARDRGEDVNLEMAYTVAAYHDLGHPIDPKNHEALSAEMMRKDRRLKDFFSRAQIETMAQAVEDHRSSKGREPRTVYGEIVSTADKNTSVDQCMMRTYEYRLKHYPEKDLEWMIEDSRQLIAEKFAFDGPAAKSMYFNDKDFTDMLTELNTLTKDPDAFRERYLKVIGVDEMEDDFTKGVESIGTEQGEELK